MKFSLGIVLGLLALGLDAQGQAFLNLNFESANVSAYGIGPADIPVANGVPGWTAYIDGSSQPDVIYNDASLGGAAVELQSSNNPQAYPLVQGKYFVILIGGYRNEGTVGIGQTGTVPLNARSLVFWGFDDSMIITFNSQPLVFTDIGNTANGYGIFTADISSFAGQTGQLLFTAPDGNSLPNQLPPGDGGSGLIDNIQFSPLPAPEPGTLALGALGGLLLAWQQRKRFGLKISD
jgi:hypothetical protein